jgi:hypothetical protein
MFGTKLLAYLHRNNGLLCEGLSRVFGRKYAGGIFFLGLDHTSGLAIELNPAIGIDVTGVERDSRMVTTRAA